MRIREISAKDIRALAKLNAGVFKDTSEKQTRKAFAHFLKNKVPGACLLAEEDGEIIGGVFMTRLVTFYEGVAMIQSLFIAPEQQGKGVGKKLLKRSLAAAKKAKVKSVSLTVRKRNCKAFDLYRKHGFEPFRLLMLKKL